MTVYTNYNNVPLALAVWLAADHGYDLKRSSHVVSATSLMKPLKSLILGSRVAEMPSEDIRVDLSSLIPSRLGTAVHAAVEVAWMHNREQALHELGYPDSVIEKIRINPDTPGDPRFDIYLEQRTSKAVGNWVVSGKFDLVENGRVKDVKTTKVYNWVKGSNDEKYKLQGSIYRWLNPDIITDDFIDVLMLFTDWSPLKVKADPDYPSQNILTRTLPLLSIAETERWIINQIAKIEASWDLHQNDLPDCTPSELWMNPAKFAYYRNPKSAKAFRVLDTAQEANALKAQENYPGSKIVARMAEPKFCKFCNGRPICLQAEGYVQAGILKR